MYLNPTKNLENLTSVFFRVSPNLKHAVGIYGILNSAKMNHGLWSVGHLHQLIMRHNIRAYGSLSYLWLLPLSISIHYLHFFSGLHALSESLPWTYYYLFSTFPIIFAMSLFLRQALSLCPVIASVQQGLERAGKPFCLFQVCSQLYPSTKPTSTSSLGGQMQYTEREK